MLLFTEFKFSVRELFQTELNGRTYRRSIADATPCRDATLVYCLPTYGRG